MEQGCFFTSFTVAWGPYQAPLWGKEVLNVKQRKNRREKRTVLYTGEGKGRRSSANLRPSPPPPQTSARFALLANFFFWIFLPTSEPAPGLHSLQALHYFTSGDDSAPVYIEKNRGTLFRKRGSPPAEPWRKVVPWKQGHPPAESTAIVYVLKALAPLPKPRADNDLTLMHALTKIVPARRVTLRSIENVTSS